ncbi:MAG TPA: DUF4214 domain-containing protein [Pyrinomonadaceae bacterium]|nr:DUF4214 domain-containing protein [Pyrinomonadaceae bacterium]
MSALARTSHFAVIIAALLLLHTEDNDLVSRTCFAQFATRTPVGDVRPLSPLAISQDMIRPASATVSLSGRIATSEGSPLGGVIVELSGAVNARTVTDGNGHFSFEGLAPGEFYNVTPQLANFTFSPQARSFSLNGNFADASFTGAPLPVVIANPLDTSEYFVRQQYLDFLGREPDQSGLDFWSQKLRACGANADCIHRESVSVSAAFFMSDEFQATGSFIYRLYKASYGTRPTFAQFTHDRGEVVDNGTDMEARRAAFIEEWVARPEFKRDYPGSLTPEDFVAKLMNSAGFPPRTGDWEAYVLLLRNGGTRAQVLASLIEDSSLKIREYNPSFVLMQYFGYLRRDADEGGLNFWLNILDSDLQQDSGYRSMVCAFITSAEYQHRFSTVVTRFNRECAP